MCFTALQQGCFALVFCGVLSLQPLVRADVSDTFSTDNGGWGHVGDSTTPPTFNATGGNPGGYISIFDLAEGSGDFMVAPAKYLGNQSGALNQTLQFDILLSDAPTGQSDDVVFSNGTTNLAYLFNPQPGAGSWIHETLTLNTSDPNWHLGTNLGPAPAQSDFQNVLSSLTLLEILADYHAGSETVGLDNVVLHTVPEPSSLALLVIAALALGCWHAIGKAHSAPGRFARFQL
jgi:hypothetical protein